MGAKLQRRDGIWVLVDLGSTNGTFVDGEKIEGETPLAPGSTVRFGDASVVFEPDDDALGLGKGGAGTKVMGAMKLDAPAPKPAAPAPPPAPAPAVVAPAPKPAAPAPVKPASKPVGGQASAPPKSKPAPKPAPAADGGAPKWLIPVIALVVIAAVAAFFLLK